jgi:hypothetical protein
MYMTCALENQWPKVPDPSSFMLHMGGHGGVDLKKVLLYSSLVPFLRFIQQLPFERRDD